MLRDRKWRTTSNTIGEEKMYRVYRLRDPREVDHSGNREYAMRKYITNRRVCDVVASRLNEDGLYTSECHKTAAGEEWLEESREASEIVHEYECHGPWLG
jgi:hypothetical protein